MTTSLFILAWLLPFFLASLAIGGYIGYGIALRRNARQIQQEREKTLAALQSVLKSAEQLSTDVDEHNTNLESVERSVVDLDGSGQYEAVKQALLTEISKAIESNRRLEYDLVCTRFLLEEQAVELDRTRRLARTDPLSGVANRMSFEETFRFMFSRYKRGGEVFSLLLVDIDHFKWINDTHGHQAGDEVVGRLGEAMRAALRPEDHVARYGGDEFTILLSGADAHQAAQIARRVRETVDQTNFDVGTTDAHIAVTLSMGMATVTPDDSCASLLDKADRALYRSKHAGRNQLTVYSETPGAARAAAQPANA